MAYSGSRAAQKSELRLRLGNLAELGRALALVTRARAEAALLAHHGPRCTANVPTRPTGTSDLP